MRVHLEKAFINLLMGEKNKNKKIKEYPEMNHSPGESPGGIKMVHYSSSLTGEAMMEALVMQETARCTVLMTGQKTGNRFRFRPKPMVL